MSNAGLRYKTTLARFFESKCKANSKQKRKMMKRILVALSIASVFAACSGNSNNSASTVDTNVIKQKAVAEEQARQREANARAVAARRAAASSSTASSQNVGSSSQPVSTGSGSAVEQPQKQGMSSRAKGALIGAGAGAIAGGIIGHNVKGAVIGGVVGAGTGYVIGRSKDKKTGRIPPKQ